MSASVVPISNPSQPAQAVLATHPFTCNTCQVAFRSSEQQRQHMHTDWHRYNIKRRISTLPPLSAETFAEKVLHVQAANRIERERATFEKKCVPCDKTYYSENAYANHVGSLKHRQNEALVEAAVRRVGGKEEDVQSEIEGSVFSLGEPVGKKENEEEELAEKVAKLQVKAEMPKIEEGEAEEESTDKKEGEEKEPESLPVTTCLFCNYSSPTLDLNISHMYKVHGMFIPEQSYLANTEGLIKYLGYKIAVGNQCLYCNKFRNSLEAVQTHMRDKGHCKIAFESEDEQLELGEFYDFRATYEDDGEEWSDEDEEMDGTAGPSKKPSTKADADGWETDSSASSLDSQDLCAVPLDHTDSTHRHSSSAPHRKEDGWHVHAHPHHHAVYHTEYELHLPSGRSVGHRQFARYYRQNLREYPTQAVSHTRYPRGRSGRDSDDEDADMADADATALSRREKRALEMGVRSGMVVRRKGDEMGLVGVGKTERRQVAGEVKRARKAEERGRKEWEWGVERRGNMQKHFRDPLLQ